MNPTDIWTHADYIAVGNIIAQALVGIAIVAATFLGPIVATRKADERRVAAEKRSQQMQVFRLMMGHRYQIIHPNYVSGLNMVQIEFSDCPNIMDKYHQFLVAAGETPASDAKWQRMEKATVKLLTEIGKELGYNLEQIDLMSQAYAPQGWFDDARKIREMVDFVSDLSQGRKALPVCAVVASQDSKASLPKS